MNAPKTALATFPADFCRQLAHSLNRWSAGQLHRVGSHISVDGLLWYVQLDESEILAFVKIHTEGSELFHRDVPGTPIRDSSLVLTGYRLNESLEFKLSSEDVSSILYVCDKINAGAESVHLTGSVTVVPAGQREMAAAA